MSQDDPINPSNKNYQVDSDNNNLGESNMIKEKVINNLPYPMPIPNTYNLVFNGAWHSSSTVGLVPINFFCIRACCSVTLLLLHMRSR